MEKGKREEERTLVETHHTDEATILNKLAAALWNFGELEESPDL